ncbi:MAG: sugar phosphate isomerase/epimerase [Candidatus Hydrogenedentota bacterium]|nr:MAG: sugar phosphate isomerase/epimerase [Candidatus Hydrogenedentota bacterium]
MRLGRNFTNLLEYDYMPESAKKKFRAGKLDVADMDCRFQEKFKADIPRQVDAAIECGMTHVELDGGIPNPFLKMKKDALLKARDYAKEKDVTLSLHLPYTFVAEATCGFQEQDRKLAVRLLKRYIDVAAVLDCVHLIMHPGSIPFYQATGLYLQRSDKSLFKSLVELGQYASDRGMKLHIENNTKWDPAHVRPEETLPLLDKVAEKGVTVWYCFDLAHTFTLVERTEDIPRPPEAPYETIPARYYSAIHIGDFVPEKVLFHPPLHHDAGLLKAEDWKRIFRIFRRKGVETVIVETAVREREDLINGRQIMLEESRYIKTIFDEVMAEPAPEPEPKN